MMGDAALAQERAAVAHERASEAQKEAAEAQLTYYRTLYESQFGR